MDDKVWQTAELTQTYLDGVRGAIPLAQAQIDVMRRLVQAAQPHPKTVLDLGCGDGILGQMILDSCPAAHGVFLDFSAPMLAAAAQRLADHDNITLIEADYGQAGWQKIVNRQSPRRRGPIVNFDVIVSGYSIHHQPDGRKQELYAELYELLTPGGIFINVEHVASPTPWLEKRFEEHFIDSLVAFHQTSNTGKTREQIDHDFYSRPDKAANILAPVETQCGWLREIGFEQVDCYLKIFELAVFGGVKPEI